MFFQLNFKMLLCHLRAERHGLGAAKQAGRYSFILAMRTIGLNNLVLQYIK